MNGTGAGVQQELGWAGSDASMDEYDQVEQENGFAAGSSDVEVDEPEQVVLSSSDDDDEQGRERTRTRRQPLPSAAELAQMPSSHPLPQYERSCRIPDIWPRADPEKGRPGKSTREMASFERIELEKREKRVAEQRKVREEGAGRWKWEWKLVEKIMGRMKEAEGGKGKGKGKAAEQGPAGGKDWRHVQFFPYANHSGMAYMEGVFAICGGKEIKLCQVTSAASSSSFPPYEVLASASSNNPMPDSNRHSEQYFTLSWSVNISTRPYTPMLAVAGQGRVVEIYLVGQKNDGTWILHHERTIPGHGGDILSLAFHPTHPHLLCTSSLDGTLRFVDATLPRGSNVAMRRRDDDEIREEERKEDELAMRRAKQGKGLRHKARIRIEQGSVLRRRDVVGELLAVVKKEGVKQAQGMLSCHFHEREPLLVTSGSDGTVDLWLLPETLLSATPAFPALPSAPVYRAPSGPPSSSSPAAAPLFLQPPIFSTDKVHSGQWPSSARFISSRSALIASSSPLVHRDMANEPKKHVKIWAPSLLDNAPDAAEKERRDADQQTNADEGKGLQPFSRFRVKSEVVLKGEHCVGDSFGMYRPREHEGVMDPLLVLPTAVRTRNDSSGGDGLFFYRPFHSSLFSSTSLPPVSSSAAHPSTSKPSLRESPRTPRNGKEVDALFPPTRDRVLHDFYPRLLPSFVADLPRLPSAPSPVEPPKKLMGEGEDDAAVESRKSPHLRAVAVQPEGARTVVGVGEGGMVAVWSRKRRSKVKMEELGMKEE
ncbi:hypothetical protein JCM8547_002490 [Rhodosporidiobolus lusitaniae]